MQNLKITIIQTDIVWENKISNLLKYEETIKTITSNPDVIILPEMFTTGFTMETSLAEPIDGYTTEWMQIMSIEKNAHMMGSIMIYDRGEIKPFNRLLCIKDQSIEYYDKKHLFAYANEDKFYTAGTERKIVNINGETKVIKVQTEEQSKPIVILPPTTKVTSSRKPFSFLTNKYILLGIVAIVILWFLIMKKYKIMKGGAKYNN